MYCMDCSGLTHGPPRPGRVRRLEESRFQVVRRVRREDGRRGHLSGQQAAQEEGPASCAHGWQARFQNSMATGFVGLDSGDSLQSPPGQNPWRGPAPADRTNRRDRSNRLPSHTPGVASLAGLRQQSAAAGPIQARILPGESGGGFVLRRAGQRSEQHDGQQEFAF